MASGLNETDEKTVLIDDLGNLIYEWVSCIEVLRLSFGGTLRYGFSV